MISSYNMHKTEGRRLFLEHYWLHLAGFAYAQYLRKNRGALLVSGSADENETRSHCPAIQTGRGDPQGFAPAHRFLFRCVPQHQKSKAADI